jgi:hypothetical protein
LQTFSIWYCTVSVEVNVKNIENQLVFFKLNGNLGTGIFNKNGENPIRSSYWDEIKCDENTQIISPYCFWGNSPQDTPSCGVEYTELINKLAKNIKNTILRDKLRGFKHECYVLSVRSNETGWLVFFSHCGADLLDLFFCFASIAEE